MCGGESVKNGNIRKKQRYKCKNCNYQFTSPDKYKAPEIKVFAMYLYLSGMSMKNISQILQVSKTTIHNWVKIGSSIYAKKRSKKHIPVFSSNITLVELMRLRRKYRSDINHFITITLSNNYFLLDAKYNHE